MSFIGEFAARPLQAWLDRFRLRHGLTGAAQPAVTPSLWSCIADERLLLHVGCGRDTKASTGTGFQSDDWREIRLDIDFGAKPDVVCSMLNMTPVPDASCDAVYSSHNIEHVYPHEVAIALAEFLRVLKSDGFLVLTCPDLQSVCSLIAEGRLIEPAYIASVGPIAPLDILYGHRPQLAAGKLFMAHHCGFTLDSLVAVLREAGFAKMYGFRRADWLDLWVLASKSRRSDEDMAALAAEYLPAIG